MRVEVRHLRHFREAVVRRVARALERRPPELERAEHVHGVALIQVGVRRGLEDALIARIVGVARDQPSGVQLRLATSQRRARVRRPDFVPLVGKAHRAVVGELGTGRGAPRRAESSCRPRRTAS